MSDNRIPLNIWIERFKNAEFENENTKVQIEAGWYDWFCRDTSLKNKTKKMGNIIKQIKDGGKINLNETFVWFKNNQIYFESSNGEIVDNRVK